MAPQYGPEVHESEVKLVDGEGRAVLYGAQGRTTWRSVDYKDKVPVVGRLLQWLRVEDLWDRAQCMVVHVSAALGAARTRKWPMIDVVHQLAADLRATLWEWGCRFAQWLGVA